jgi:hypothetical protein
MEKTKSLKKLLVICLGNVILAYCILLIFLNDVKLGSWIQMLTIFFVIIFLGLLIVRAIFKKFKGNVVRYFFTLLVAFFSAVISFSLCIFTGSDNANNLLNSVVDSLMFSLLINIFIVFWAWILAGTIVYYIYYCHYNDTSWMED